MHRRLILICALCCLSASLFALHFSAASVALHVNETATRVRLREGETCVALALENKTGRDLPVHIKLELLDPENHVRANTGHYETIKTGSNTVTVPLPLKLKEDKERSKMLWYRLRYRVSSFASEAAITPSEGLISLSEITPDIFDLRLIVSEYPFPGRRYRAYVRAAHPLTARPVSGVSVSAEIKFDHEPASKPLKATAVTDARGYAAVDFDLPRTLNVHDGELKVTARRGDFEREAAADLRDEHLQLGRILLSTDRPLYQPGQVLHLRALAFDFSQRAIADAGMKLVISDPEGTTLFRAALKTSRFGVSNADWPIPESTRLGEYKVSVELEDDRYGSNESLTFVKISRYDLPNFTVSVKPNRAYYLSGQNAEVEVRADYLFGQPVARGHVRVVRETDREWNYREQKWETKEEEKREGEVDAAGHFTARIDLKAAHTEMAEENYRRFRDLHYAAYFTDATTGRTEQRGFDLRVTREAIHVYLIGEDYRQTENFPLQFYLSTSYADGTPASCEVAISESIATKSFGRMKPAAYEQPLRKIKTNRYGVAKVNDLLLSQRDDRDREVALSFVARDSRGVSGRHTEGLWRSMDRTVIRVESDKTLYRVGEPIEVQINSNQPNLTLLLTAMHEMKIIHSQVVSLRQGRAFVILPYRDEFKNEVTITAQAEADRGAHCCDYSYGSRTVLYPRDHELKLNVRLDQAEHRPGEEAQASFRVQRADGRAVESVLGVSVIDRAVEERARTDQFFGSRSPAYDDFRSYLGFDDSLAGITRRDLNRLDLAQPLPDGLELVAELLLRRNGYAPRIFGGDDDYTKDQSAVFGQLTAAQLQPMKDALSALYQKQAEYPADQTALVRILTGAGVSFDDLRDPWGTAYRAAFSVENEFDVLEMTSAGADKRFGTADDFSAAQLRWPYFKPQSDAITRAVQQYLARGVITHDLSAFKAELKQRDVDFNALRDRWGQAYELSFEVNGAWLLVSVRSSGSNGQFEKTGEWPSDDFIVWKKTFDYFEATRARINEILGEHYKLTGSFPQNDTDLRGVLKQGGMDFDALRDPWGHPYYATFHRTVNYADHVTVTYSGQGSSAKSHTEIRPISQQINFIFLRSGGADGATGTKDDFEVAEFLRMTAAATAQNQNPPPLSDSTILSGSTGAINGTITDPNGAVIPGVEVKAIDKNTSRIYETKTEANGKFLLRDLPAGLYDLSFHSPGFKAAIVTDVIVQSSNLVQIQCALEVGTASESVVVTGSSETIQTVSPNASLSVISKPGTAVVKQSSLISTPRLREYFPETLVWQPQLETDKQGRAQLKFKLADNITTWKLAVIGSTLDGEIGMAEKEFRAFQPFFAELDPPRVLTEGDEIALPVVLRNYLDKAQAVNVEMKPENWFTLLGPARQRTEVAAGDATRAIFDLRAIASIKDGKQRVTAIGTHASDAIEKPVTVHPDGEEITQTASQVFTDAGALEINMPSETIKGSARAELKIYPNLMAHALEGIEGIMQRPYGCGEQTISSSYPSLLVLRYLKGLGGASPAITTKAQRYLQAGYERLLGYRASDGGFNYWGRGEADLALTAYALRFLNDAQEFVAVDKDVMEEARDWLIKQQHTDGSWPAPSYWSGAEAQRRAALNTAYIARVLAATGLKITDGGNDNNDKKASGKTSSASNDPAAALQRALEFLSRRMDEIDEPYLIACYALAANEAGEKAGAMRAISKLRALVRDEAGTNYWNLETNTPFYGWGLAGRIETTALAVKALALATEITEATESKEKTSGTLDKNSAPSVSSVSSVAKHDPLVDRGLLFLLRNKDRYGVWLSTQATINVLDALVTLNEMGSAKVDAGGQAEVIINSQRAASITMPPGNRLSNPMTVDLTPFLATGSNRVEIRRVSGSAVATAQMVESHYVPWSPSLMTKTENFKPGASSGLRLAVSFDKTEAKIGEEVTCRVQAERVGFRGYGMMLAEIGLPPGADVDRASLERAMKESGWEINQYDILPDRLIVYLWPRAGGSRFEFKLRPRFGIKAQTASSALYDYYNPEANVVVAPTHFIVK